LPRAPANRSGDRVEGGGLEAAVQGAHLRGRVVVVPGLQATAEVDDGGVLFGLDEFGEGIDVLGRVGEVFLEEADEMSRQPVNRCPSLAVYCRTARAAAMTSNSSVWQ